MRQSRLILSNAVIIWITQGLQLIPQLILVPYLIGTIGESGYGVYVLLWSLMVSIDQLENSLQSGVVKYSAGFLAQGRMDEVNKVVSSSFVYSIFLAILTFIGIFISTIFYNDPSGQMRPALIVVGIMILLIIPLTPYIAMIQSKQHFYVGAIAGTMSKYIGLFATILWFTWMTPSVKAVIVIMAGTLLLSRLIQVPIAYRLVPGMRNRISSFDLQIFRKIVFFGGVIVIVGLCLMANSTGVNWMMGILSSTTFVTHLAIIMMPLGLLMQIVLAMTVTVMPATSAYHATGNNKMLRELLIRGMRYTTILTLAGLLVAVFLMRNALSVWVGSHYVFLTPYALTLFASGAFMLSTSTSHHMLKGLGLLRITVFISITGLVIVPIGLMLVVFLMWHNPYIAATLGFATGHLVYGFLQIRFSVKETRADFRNVIIRVYAQPLVVALLAYVAVLTLPVYVGVDGLIGRLCVAILAVLLFISGCYALIATPTERNELKNIAQAVIDKITTAKRARHKQAL